MEGIRGPLNTPSAPLINNKETGIRESGFADSLKSFYQSVNAESKEADKKVAAFATGKPIGIHDVVIATEKAGLSLRFLLQIRNKLLEGYQEIMRMQF
mgnify:CR=1 FL=1